MTPGNGPVPDTSEAGEASPTETPPSATPPSATPQRRRGVRVTSAAALALGLALAGGSVAAAATAPSPSTSSSSVPPGGRPPGGGSPPAAVGTVKSVGDGTFTITTSDGTTVTVNVSGSTKYLDHDVATPSFANVTVGQHVAVFGSDTSNVVTATSVAVGAPPSGPPPTPGGTTGGKAPAWSGSSPPSSPSL